jgi:hypothetical protein
VVLFGYSGSSTAKTGRHDIAFKLLKVALNTTYQIKIYGKEVEKNRTNSNNLQKHFQRAVSPLR